MVAEVRFSTTESRPPVSDVPRFTLTIDSPNHRNCSCSLASAKKGREPWFAAIVGAFDARNRLVPLSLINNPVV